jgi:hypothetical protein
MKLSWSSDGTAVAGAGVIKDIISFREMEV